MGVHRPPRFSTQGVRTHSTQIHRSVDLSGCRTASVRIPVKHQIAVPYVPVFRLTPYAASWPCVSLFSGVVGGAESPRRSPVGGV